MHTDPVLTAFLTEQRREGLALAEASDLFDLEPLGRDRFIARFRCRGLVRTRDGQIREANHFEVGIRFVPDHLTRAHSAEVLCWLRPRTVFHPNIAGGGSPFVCIGVVARGAPLVEIVYRVYELITFQEVTTVEADALNRDACRWVRHHPELLPVDPRPLKRRAHKPEIAVLEGAS